MTERVLWSIGSADGKSPEIVDTYRTPEMLGDVVWHVPRPEEEAPPQHWPIFHPSEADPEAGYRPHPYIIEFDLEGEPPPALLRISYLVISPRLPSVEVRVNDVPGWVYLRPLPSRSGEIRLHAGLHTSIYAEGTAQVAIPAHLLRSGSNRIVLVAWDCGEVLRIDGIERIRRLDRMANGAGLIYQQIELLDGPSADRPTGGKPSWLRTVELKPTVVYRRDEGGVLWERCDLYLELADATPAREMVLRLETHGGTEERRFEVPDTAFGHLRFPFELRDGEGMVRCSLHSDGHGYVVETRRCRKWTVYVTPHAHTDIGYTHRQWEVAERLSRNIDRVLELLEERPDAAFAYHLDSSWTLDTWLATRDEYLKRRLIEHVRAGRIGIAASYVDLLTQIAGLEDLIRNNEPTEQLLRPEGLRSDFTTVVDVASVSGSLPAILEGAGVRYLVHADNQDRGPFRLNGGLNRISPYWWEGVSGGRVLVWLAKMYCELRKVCGSPAVPDSAERGLQLWLEEYERPDFVPDAVLMYGQEADNTDMDFQPEEFVRRWNEENAFPRLVPSAVSDFFHYVEERFGDDLPVVRGEGGAYWEDGAGSHIASTIMVRSAQASLPAAEILDSLAVLHGQHLTPAVSEFDEAWRQVLLFDEHTWGAFLSVNDPEALLQQDIWAAKENVARDAAARAEHLLHAAAVRHSLSWNTDGREVVVYNPHNWTMSGPAQVEIARGEVLIDAESGVELPVRLVRETTTQAVIELWVDALPGLSYRRFPLREKGSESKEFHWDNPPVTQGVPVPVVLEKPGSQGPTTPAEGAAHLPHAGIVGGYDRDRHGGTVPTPLEGGVPPGVSLEGGAANSASLPDADTVVLENNWYRVEIDPDQGCVISWRDLDLDRELVDTSDPYGLGSMLYARGGEGTRLVSNQSDLPEGAPEILDNFRLLERNTTRHAHGQTMRLVGEVPAGTLTVEWSLPNATKCLDVAYMYLKEERLSKEAVYVAFPLDLRGAHVLSDSQLGWVSWSKDELPGACKEWLPLQSGIVAEGDGAQILICSPDIPLFCIGDVVRGRWPRELDLTGGRLFSYVLNNYWHTNYKASQGGEIRFRYRLTSGPSVPRADAYRMGWEMRRPLYAHRISFQDFRKDVSPYSGRDGGGLARIEGEGVALSTIKRARWSGGVVLRLQEIAGRQGVASISFPGLKVARAWKCDLLERELDELPVRADGGLAVEVPAWGLVTVRIEMAEEPT